MEFWEGLLLATDLLTTGAEATFRVDSKDGFRTGCWNNNLMANKSPSQHFNHIDDHFQSRYFDYYQSALYLRAFFPSCKWWSCLSENKELHSRERIDCSSLPNLICSNTILQYFEFSTDWPWNIIKGILYGVMVIAAFCTNLTPKACYVSSMQNIIGVWKWTHIRVLKLVKW